MLGEDCSKLTEGGRLLGARDCPLNDVGCLGKALRLFGLGPRKAEEIT